MAQGLEKIPIRWPEKYDPAFMEAFVRDVLAKADIRNALAGPGITIEGQSDEPATLSAEADVLQLLEQSYILATTSSFLENERILRGQTGKVTITDNGPNNSLIVGIASNGIGGEQFRQSAELSVVGRPQLSNGNVSDIESETNDTMLMRRANALVFDSLIETDIPPEIARDAEVTAAANAAQAAAEATAAAALTAHEGAANPHPGYLTPTEGDAAYQPLAAVLSMLHTGTGSPESVVTAPVGHIYLRGDGGAGTTLYVKESGASSTGWIAK